MPKLSLPTIKTRRSRAAPANGERQPGASELSARRDELATSFAETQWDLGGIVYEMARRDHFRMDLVVRHAARLQAIDAELDEVQQLLALEQAPAAGTCASCGAPYAHGAAFCSKCGAPLTVAPLPPENAEGT